MLEMGKAENSLVFVENDEQLSNMCVFLFGNVCLSLLFGILCD